MGKDQRGTCPRRHRSASASKDQGTGRLQEEERGGAGGHGLLMDTLYFRITQIDNLLNENKAKNSFTMKDVWNKMGILCTGKNTQLEKLLG